MVLHSIFITFVEKFLIMTLHELTQAEIAALNKLGVSSFSYFQKHLPIKSGNIYIAETNESLKRLSQAIAVDVYTSGIGRARIRYCYDCFRQLNIRGKFYSGNLETYIRNLDENVKRYLAILCDQ